MQVIVGFCCFRYSDEAFAIEISRITRLWLHLVSLHYKNENCFESACGLCDFLCDKIKKVKIDGHQLQAIGILGML